MVAVSEVSNTAWDVVRGALADAAIRARHAVKQRPSTKPIAIVAAPRITDKLGERLRAYHATYTPDVGWGIFDGDGRLDLWGDIEIHVEPKRPSRGATPRTVNLWSDLGRWVMKVLVMNTIAPGEAQRWMIDVRGANHAELSRRLAGIRGPSPSLVWQVTAQMKREGFLTDDLIVLRADELLERWRRRQTRIEHHPMSWILPGGDTRSRMVQHMPMADAEVRERLSPLVARGAGRACLAGFTACREHGVAITPPGVTEVYLRSLELTKEIRLTPTPAGQKPDVLVRVPEAPESVFRGVGQASDGALYTDLIQCWLDLVDASAQGAKQASTIWKRFHFP